MTSNDATDRVPSDRGDDLPRMTAARRTPGSGETWAIVLAAGEGSRLRALTTNASGVAVPKQFCSLREGPSLLHEALQRAENVAADERICAVVAAQHAHWWRQPLAALQPDNVIVQPQNRGTANGILLPLLHILERDPQARVVVLPSDHHVDDESVLGAALRRALGTIRERRAGIVLLGMAPEDADSELGYIMPCSDGADGLASVARFVEKPSAPEARALIARGALWNVFIIAAQALSLVSLFIRHDARVVRRLRTAMTRDARNSTTASFVADEYRRMPNIDFSHHIAQGHEAALEVLRVPSCGWSDLGTLERVDRTLRGAPTPTAQQHSIFQATGHLSLERQHTESQRALASAQAS